MDKKDGIHLTTESSGKVALMELVELVETDARKTAKIIGQGVKWNREIQTNVQGQSGHHLHGQQDNILNQRKTGPNN